MYKEKLNLLLSLLLFAGTPGIVLANDATTPQDVVVQREELETQTSFDAIMANLPLPDNVTQETTTNAVTLGTAGVALFVLAQTIAKTPCFKEVLDMVCQGQVATDDLLRGIGFSVSILGVLGLYENATQLRQQFMNATIISALLKQIQTPGVIEKDEVLSSAIKGVLGLGIFHSLAAFLDTQNILLKKKKSKRVKAC